MIIRRLEQFNRQDFDAMETLMSQWSDKKRQNSVGYFNQLIQKSYLFVMDDAGSIIGTVTIVPLYKLSGLKGSVEHVLVDEAYRGKGLGEKLMRHAIEYAKQQGMGKLFLTVEPERVVAKKLYQKLGFTKKETDFYQLSL